MKPSIYWKDQPDGRIRKKANQGSSLIELITVLAIMGLFLLLGVTSLVKKIKASQIKTVAEQLISDLQWARSLALKYGSSRIKFDNNTQYAIYAPVTEDIPLKVIRLAENVILTEDLSSKIDFKVNTLPNKNGTITIIGSGKEYHIVINLNGRIRLEVE